MRKLQTLTILILLFLLAACTPQAAATSTAVPATETPTPAPSSTASPTPEPSPTVTETPAPTLSPEKAIWAQAKAAAEKVEGALPYVYDAEKGIIIYEDENGNQVEKNAGINPNDVWEKNFDERFAPFLKETIKLDNFCAKKYSPTGKTELSREIYPIVITGEVKKLKQDLGLEMKAEGAVKDFEWPGLEAFLIMPPNKQNCGIMVNIIIELPRHFEIYYDLKEGRFYLDNDYDFLLRMIEDSGNWWKNKIKLEENSIYLIPAAFDYDGNTFHRNCDGLDPYTEEERINSALSATMYTKPTGAYVINNKDQMNKLLTNPSIASNKAILIPTGYFIIP